jgi:Flp pilus assembly protein TadD
LSLTIDSKAPAFVSLALGSAYFRFGKLEDAEREYKAALEVDPRAGEAHSNLAVVYLETGRYADAERAVVAAEKAGFTVHPQLKQDIDSRKKRT